MTRAPLSAILLLVAGASAAPAAAPPPRSGLWIGPIHICRDSAAQAVTDTDARGAPIATVTLRPAWRARLARETGRRVGRPFPIRLDGRLIAEPVVLEPLTAGILMLPGRSPADAEAIRAAAGRAC